MTATSRTAIERVVWSARWRAQLIRWAVAVALKWEPKNPGNHRFIDGVCLCGHRTTNDPERCPIWK